MLDIATVQQMLAPGLPGLMGLTLTSLAPDRVTATLAVRPELCTVGGILHGGAYMAFADTLGAVGTASPSGQRTTTTDSSTKFIASAKVGTVVSGECLALHRGRSTQVWQTLVRNADGRLCAVVTQTQLLIDAPAPLVPGDGAARSPS